MNRPRFPFLSRLVCCVPVFLAWNAFAGSVIKVENAKVVSPAISKLVFGVNMACFGKSSSSPEVVKSLGSWCELIRWPSGECTEMYDWYHHTRDGKACPPELTTAAFAETTAKHINGGVPMLLGVNTSIAFPGSANSALVKSSFPKAIPEGPQFAADYVRYCNRDLNKPAGANRAHSASLGIHFWEIGNEPDLMGTKRLGMPEQAIVPAYAQVFRSYFKAMTAADPAIQVLGPVFTKQRFETQYPAFLKSCGDLVDIVSFHCYPPRDNKKINNIQEGLERGNIYEPMITSLHGWIDQYCVDSPRRKKSDIKIAVTEYNAGSSWSEWKKWEHGVWIADVLCTFMKNQVYMACLWHVSMGADEHSHSLYDADHGYQPAPAHYALAFLHEHSHVREGSRMLAGSSSSPTLAVYPVEHGNRLSLIVINKSAEPNTGASLELGRPVRTGGKLYELTKESPAAVRSVDASKGPLTITFQPYSINCVELEYEK